MTEAGKFYSPSVIVFADVLVAVAGRHEESWNPSAEEYDLSIEEAALVVGDGDRMSMQPVVMLLNHNWNESLEWANTVLEENRKASEAVMEQYIDALDDLIRQIFPD